MSNPEIDTDGNKYWYYRDKKIHRIEYINGTQSWYQNNKLHRTHGPAIIHVDGRKEYWVNGKLHRMDGPAIEYSYGYKSYYIYGKRYDSLEALLMDQALE